MIPSGLTMIFLVMVTGLLICLLTGLYRVLTLSKSKRALKICLLTGFLLLIWLGFISYLSTIHFLDQFSALPPHMAVVLLPPIAFILFLVHYKKTNEIISFIPRGWLVFIHSFRIVSGILFYLLYRHDILPVQMTFLGNNIDLFFGLSAPLVGFLHLKKKLPAWILAGWHLTGIIMLFVLVVTAVLSAPFPFRLYLSGPQNVIIAYFPFVMMPGFVIPFGIVMHLLALKKELRIPILESRKLQDGLIRSIGIPLVALLIGIFLNFQFGILSPDFYFGFLLAFGFTLLLWYGDRLIIAQVRKRFPEYDQTLKRLLVEFGCILVFTFVSVLVIDSFFFVYVFHQKPGTGEVMRDILAGKLISMVMLLVYESIYFFQCWKQNVREVEQLKCLQTQHNLDLLKNRLNPHFLFSSLNTLVTMVETDDGGTSRFIQKLADVYRYILQSNEATLNTVKAEVKFAADYFYILNVRYGNNLIFSQTIDCDMMKLQLPQLSLQHLADHAVTTSVISASKPLKILISGADQDTLEVCYTNQKKSLLMHTGKDSLEELRSRYRMLLNRDIEVREDAETCCIKIPLVSAGQDSVKKTDVRAENLNISKW